MIRQVKATMAPAIYTLEISQDVADTLMQICNIVGGDPNKYRRSDTDAICAALEALGVHVPLGFYDSDIKEGGHIYFKDTK